jgi:glucose-1-phosphate thymidylyltransferase
LKIACLEEVALRMGFLDCKGMAAAIADTPASSYRDYLKRVYNETELCGGGKKL